MVNRLQKGFTLIELLVVIAIIGILSSVVLASLNSARNKGTDAAIKASLANARAQAELYYDSNGNYAGVCTNSATGIQAMILAAAQRLGGTTQTVGGNASLAYAYAQAGDAATGRAAECHDSASGWAAIVSLKGPVNSATGGWCVDSTGKSAEFNVLNAVGAYPAGLACGS